MNPLLIAAIAAAVIAVLVILLERRLNGGRPGRHAPRPQAPASNPPLTSMPPTASESLTLPPLPDMMPATVLLPGLGHGGTWTPRPSDDTIRYLADAGALDPETEGEQARLREELAEIRRGMTARLQMTEPGADSHVRTDASAPGWLGATLWSSHRSPDWREQTAAELDPDTLAGQAVPLPPALASAGEDDDQEIICYCAMSNGDASAITTVFECPVHGDWFDGSDDARHAAYYEGQPTGEQPAVIFTADRDVDWATLAAFTEALTERLTENVSRPGQSQVSGGAPGSSPAPPAGPGDPDALVVAAEVEAWTVERALEYAAETGWPQSADPVWAACSGPWVLLEEEAERLCAA